jgi:tRNA1(Val) A37 N6-methylase TrmN6
MLSEKTLDHTLLNGHVKIKQLEHGFHVAIDTVLAAAAVPVMPKAKIVDLGAGIGGISLCVKYRLPEADITGIEIQPEYHALAEQNAKDNGFDKGLRFLCQDIKDFKEINYDIVVSNPPFLEEGSYNASPDTAKNTAIGNVHLEDWIHVANRALKPGGTLVMIHRADYLQKIFAAMGSKFGGVEVIPLYPKEGVACKRVIIRALKGKKSASKIHPGLFIHKSDGSYTEKSQALLRDGHALV